MNPLKDLAYRIHDGKMIDKIESSLRKHLDSRHDAGRKPISDLSHAAAILLIKEIDDIVGDRYNTDKIKSLIDAS